MEVEKLVTSTKEFQYLNYLREDQDRRESEKLDELELLQYLKENPSIMSVDQWNKLKLKMANISQIMANVPHKNGVII